MGQRGLWTRHAALEADEIQWVVFLKDGAERAPVEDQLRTLPGLRSLRFISKDEALASAQADPAFSEGLSLTGGNPFPESFTVQWDPRFLREDLLSHHSDRFRAMPGVDAVDYDKPRVERFSLSQKALSRLDLALETLTAVAIGLLLAMAGRLLFFSKTAASAPMLSGGLAASFIGGSAGAGSAYWLGAPAGPAELLAGAAAAGILVLAAEAFQA